MRATPKTDAVTFDLDKYLMRVPSPDGYGDYVDPDFARSLERSNAELLEAIGDYMSQFGQALNAYGVPFQDAQIAADVRLRAAIAKAKEIQ